MLDFPNLRLFFRLFSIVCLLPFFGVHAFATPTAKSDTYYVDVNGSLSVRSSYSSTITAKTPSLFWNLNDVSLQGTAPSIPSTIDSGSDSVDGTGFLYSTSASINLSNAPLLAPSGGFKGFASSNVWWELGDADSGVGGNGGFINNVVNPKTAWGSEVGSISMWFRIPADKTGLNDPTTFGKSVIFEGVNTSDYSALPYSVYKTSVVIFYSESKLTFNLYQDGTTLASFTTSSTYNDNAWHHLVASWDNATGNVAAFHVDGGSLVGADKSYTGQSYYDLTTDFTFDARLKVGQGEFSQTAFNGFIDELAIWTEDALTAADARDLFFAGLGGPLANDSTTGGQEFDGSNLNWGNSLSAASGGTVTWIDSSGAFDYAAPSTEGNYTFTYQLSDGTSPATGTVQINVNGPPTTNPDSYSVTEGSSLPIPASSGVLVNDWDTGTLSARIAIPPAKGTLILYPEGNFTYDPTGGTPASSGDTVTFTYKASDGSLDSLATTVTLTIQDANTPTYANLSGDTVTFTDGGLAVELDSGSDSTVTDVDTTVFNGGGTLTVSVTSVDASEVLAIKNVGSGSGQIGVAGSNVSYEGSVIGTFAGGSSSTALVITFTTADATIAAVEALGHVITYEAGSGLNGQSRTVTYSLSDGSNAGTATVNVNVVGAPVNNAPVITSNSGGPTASLSVAENQIAVTTVAATDADGDALTYTISGGADQSKFDLNSTTGVLTFKVAPDYEANESAAGNNAYVVEVNVSDGTIADTQTITVTVTDVNEIPVITSVATNLVSEN
ncbi:MAG: hypothetical protein HN494_17340, partial [Opitutae bacterium]|nr:hypothetical protein [Opitutae bacterium]